MAHAQAGWTLGLIVNPIAGMGGAVGLKGTDGTEVLREAIRRGATPRAPARARAAMNAARDTLLAAGARILTCPGAMGQDEVVAAGLAASIIDLPHADTPCADDTRAAARHLRAAQVDLLLFAGGDGTACDILSAVGSEFPVLGIPAGVKLHSGVFATSPRAAGEVVSRMAAGEGALLRHAEVMDIDEDAYRAGNVSARLFGYLSVPSIERALQMPKARSIPEASASASVARAVAAMMADASTASTLWIIGPGTTTRAVMAELGLEGSLLGVDVVRGGAVLARDVDEAALLRMIQENRAELLAQHAHADALRGGAPPAAAATAPKAPGSITAGSAAVATALAKIVVTPIGGQGYIFGRGNHQLSARILEAVGRDNILVIATPAKLFGLHGAPLRVDIDDERVNRSLRGYMRVITGAGQEIVYPVDT